MQEFLNITIIQSSMPYMYFFQAHLRLNHLRLAVSPDATLAKVNQFGSRFDEKVLRWMEIIRRFSSGIIIVHVNGMPNAVAKLVL